MQKISKKNTLFFYNFYFLIFGSRNFRQLQMCNLNRKLITHNQWFLIFMNFKEKYSNNK